MKVGRNYTAALETLNEQNTESINGPKPCNLNLMIKIYDAGALTPTLGALKVGMYFCLKNFVALNFSELKITFGQFWNQVSLGL